MFAYQAFRSTSNLLSRVKPSLTHKPQLRLHSRSSLPPIPKSLGGLEPVLSEEEIQKLIDDMDAGDKAFTLPTPTDPAKVSKDLVDTILKYYTPLYQEAVQSDKKKYQLPYQFLALPEGERNAASLFYNGQLLYLEGVKKSDPLNGPIAHARLTAIAENRAKQHNKEPVVVAVTGASGQIGYALLFRIASGDMFGPHQPVILKLLELPQAMNALKGVVMEIRDCAFPLVKDIVSTDVPEKAFEGVDYALLVGAQPRTKGMERGDLLMKNAEIFSVQGKALNAVGKGKDTRVAVVGNPANTNALIAQRNASKIPPKNFSAMTRLDHNRGLAQLAEKANTTVESINRFVIWGNHSATQFPDIAHADVNGKPLDSIITDTNWINKTFIPSVQQRGAAIISARGASSAASAAGALVDHIYDWHHGTHTHWTSMAVHSNGEYGVEPGLFYSYPVVINDNKEWGIVKDLPITEDAARLMEATHKELQQERDGVSKFLPK